MTPIPIIILITKYYMYYIYLKLNTYLIDYINNLINFIIIIHKL